MPNGMRGFGIRPPVQTIEPINLESQWRVPRNEAWLGVGGCTFVGLASLGWLMYITPRELSTQAIIGVLIVGIVATFWRSLVDFVDQAKTAIYGSVLTVALAMGVWFVWDLPNWEPMALPENGYLAWLLFCVGFAGLFVGIFGDVRFMRELIDKFELTGKEKLQLKLAQEERQWEREKELLASGLHELQLRNSELEDEVAELLETEPAPLIRTDLDEGRQLRAELKFKLGIAQFLVVGMVRGFGRSAWVDKELPAFTVTQVLWSYLCSRGTGVMHQRECPVFTKEKNATVLNLKEYDIETLIKMAQTVRPPEEWRNNG